MSEQENLEGTLYSFGTIAQTQILKVQDEQCLPYNPFTFDLNLRIIKSIEPYESGLTFIINSGCRSVFGRKKSEVEHMLKAPTVSSRHFSVDQRQRIMDLGSTKGTYIWVQRDRPVEIYSDKILLIGNAQIEIQKIDPSHRTITISMNNKEYNLCPNKDNLILLGSHKNCHLKIPGKEYYCAIDLLNLRLHTFLQNQQSDYEWEKGVWQRLSKGKQESEGRVLEPEDVIMVYPYMLKVQY